MRHFSDSEILAFACDVASDTGEGFLAQAVLAQIAATESVCLYCDPIVERLRTVPLARDRLLPIYLALVILFSLLARRKCLLLNYVPIWNFMNAGLTRLGLRLGPVTGSVGVLPARPGRRERWVRGVLQRVLAVTAMKLLAPTKCYWAATPSVHDALSARIASPVVFGFPVAPHVRERCVTEKDYDFFFYSTNHPLKNHAAALALAERLAGAGYKVFCVGDGFSEASPLLTARSRLDEGEFNAILAGSRVFVSTSFEDAGITCLKALASGVPALCPRSSGMAVMVENDATWCFDDPYETDVVSSRATALLNSSESAAPIARLRFRRAKEAAAAAFAIWKSSL